jgi:hypothetical protein
MPWLEEAYKIDASDWIVLSAKGWKEAAAEEPTIWDALERKLAIGFYLNEPELIAVIGHPRRTDSDVKGQQEVRRIVNRVCSLLLPPAVIGLWADDDGWMADTGESDGPTASEHDIPAVWLSRATRSRW